MLLPDAADMYTLLLRTDYTDDLAWQNAVRAATAVYDVGGLHRLGALMQPVESPELNRLPPNDLVQLPRTGYLSLLAVADARTMTDLTILFIDLNEYNEQIGRTFRAVPPAVEPITVNLVLANMDFFEFADADDADGVFRGFADPATES